MKQYFFDKLMFYCYPYGTSQKVPCYGVLDKYMGKKFTRDEIDKIICKLITRHPYVSGSMSLELSISQADSEGNYREYYHILTFKNDKYENQEKGSTILFEK